MVATIEWGRGLGSRVARSIAREVRDWSGLVAAGAVFAAVVAAAFYLITVPVAGQDPQSSFDVVSQGLGWFACAAAAALVLHLARGLMIGLSNDIYVGARNGRRIMVWGASLAVAAAALFIGAEAKAAEQAPADYCSRDLGTWFYCTRPEPEPAADEKPDAAPKLSEEERELAKFEKFKADLERASKLAVWNPTPENVERFFRMQRAALNQSSLFSDQYRRLVWQRPDLDYTLKRPVSELGKRDWIDTRAADRELFLKKISGDVGLFYVFRANCSACKVFSPIMRDFANRYALTVKGVSVDGSANAYIATSFVDRGQLRSWGIDNPTTPAILLFQNSSIDARTGEARPLQVRLSDDRLVTVAPCMKPQGCLSYIGAGVMAQDDIIERIYVMLATTPGEDY